MRRVAFCGPTTSDLDRGRWPNVTFLPPAAAGDVITAVRAGAGAIAIVDGYFETRRSVWHKEILWALDQGVVVLGASSMGALRAAELSAFGMIGIGEVFERYASGELEDDDDVALLHGPPETDYLPLTAAMVNVRCAVDAACLAGRITENQRQHVLESAKSLNYKHRTYENILKIISERENKISINAAMKNLFDDMVVDIKMVDAMKALDYLNDGLGSADGGCASFSLSMTEQLACLIVEAGNS